MVLVVATDFIGLCGFLFFFQAEDGIRDVERSRGLGDVYTRQQSCKSERLVVFFWYGRDQMGPGGAELYIFRYGEPLSLIHI